MTSAADTPGDADRDIAFFTCANKAYEHFAPVYAASVLGHLPSARVEFGLEDVASFRRDNPAMAVLEAAYPGRVLLRDVPWTYGGRHVAPNSIRFMEAPLTAATWTYIGDIDIVFLDRLFFEQHLPFMARTGLPYSNSLRPGTTRLTGLHLVRSDAWYPLPSLEGLEPNHDEVMLHDICVRKGLPVQDGEWFRPVHGVHISPNRAVEGWGVRPWRSRYLDFVGSDLFRELRPLLAPAMQALLAQVDEEVARPAVLHQINGAVEQDRSKPAALGDYTETRSKLLAEKNYQAAAELGLRFLRSHPDEAVVHHQTAWTLAALKLLPEAIELQRRAVELAPGRADFRAALERFEAAEGRGRSPR